MPALPIRKRARSCSANQMIRLHRQNISTRKIFSALFLDTVNSYNFFEGWKRHLVEVTKEQVLPFMRWSATHRNIYFFKLNIANVMNDFLR
jgi:hypothetical protein